jgi:hypothetical protein
MIVRRNPMKNNDEKIEKLTDWINEQGQWAEDYVSHEDNINNYAECFEPHNLHYDDIDEEHQEEVKELLEDMDAYDILEYCDEPDIHYGIRCRSDEIWSMSFGEIETQITGIYDHETKSNCVYTDLCEGLSAEEIEQAENACDHYVRDGYIYQDHSYDRVSIVLDVDRLLKQKSKTRLKIVS